MPTDAKCGLLVGVGVVLTVAVLFFQKEPPPADAPVPQIAQTKSPAPAAAVNAPGRSPVSGVPVSRPTQADDPGRPLTGNPVE